jgi:hypothetical protein
MDNKTLILAETLLKLINSISPDLDTNDCDYLKKVAIDTLKKILENVK